MLQISNLLHFGFELQQRALTPQLVGAKRRSRFSGAAGSFNFRLQTFWAMVKTY